MGRIGNKLDPIGNHWGKPSDSPVRLNQRHRPYSNYVAVMSSLGHFHDSGMSYGQASQRMNPSYHVREQEICKQFARDEGASTVEYGTAVLGEPLEPPETDPQAQWEIQDDRNTNVALGSVSTELDHVYQLNRQQQQQQISVHQHDRNPTSHQAKLHLPPSTSRKILTLKEWIDLHKPQSNRSSPALSPSTTDNSPNNALSISQKKYLQQCIGIAHKVVNKIISETEQSKIRQRQQNLQNTNAHDNDFGGLEASFDFHEGWEPRPSDVSLEYITVTETTDASHQSDNDSNDHDNENCGDVKTTVEDINFDVLTNFNWEHSPWAEDSKANGDGDDDTSILHAVATLLYEMFMEGEELPTSVMHASGERAERRDSAPSIEGVMEMLQMIASDESTNGDDSVKNDSRDSNDDVFTRMREAALPIPLCRLVSDIFREASKREAPKHYHQYRMTLSDVSSDLEQMMDDPDAFLYASRTSRWELIFGNNHMFGRKEELTHLMDAAARVERVDSPKEVILISGHAGSGKSRLAHEIRKPLTARGWKFLRCKFEKAIPSEPLSVVALGLDEFFSTSMFCPPMTNMTTPMTKKENGVCTCSDHSCQRKIIRELYNLVGLDSLRTLSHWMPSLRRLVKEFYPAHISYFEVGLAEQQQHQMTEEDIQTLIHLLGVLLELVASASPVLFFVDDWADVSTMTLLTSLITMVGTTIRSVDNTCSLLFLGACRIDDGTEELVLRHLLHEFDTTHSIQVSRISLKGVEVKSLNEMMSEVLCLPRRKTRSLSQVLAEKTQGMPLFVVEFVDALLAEDFLTQSYKHGWEWNADAIRCRPIAKGFAELLSRKLERLPLNVSKCLQTLSCFASRIDLQVVDALKDYDPSENTDVDLAIDVAKREFLGDISESTFAFSHELIQKAAFDLIPMVDRIPLLLGLVACLITKCSSDTSDTDVFLFATVDLMNRIDSNFVFNSPQDSQLFAEYNLMAGKRLIELAKFTAASEYLQTGITFLQGTGWVNNYYLTVDLVSNLAKSSYSLGHYQECFAQVNQVLENATTFENKFVSYCLYINLLGVESIDSALEKLYYLLPLAGEPIDTNVISYQLAIDEMMALKQELSGNQMDMLLSLPSITDCRRLMSMKLLGLLILYSSQQKSFLGGYLAARMIRLSLQYGQCEDSVYAMSVFSSSLVYMVNEIDEAYALAQVTLNYNTNRLIPRVYALIYGIVLSTKDMIYSTLGPLSSACQLAFSHGVHEHAIINTLIYVTTCLYGGEKLPVLIKELVLLAEQHQKINQINIIIHFLGPMYKTVSELSGVILNESDILSSYASTTNDFVNAAIAHNELVFVRIAVGIVLFESVIIRDFAKAADLIIKYSNFFEILNNGHKVAFEYNHFFVAGLVSFHMAREIRDSHWIEKGTNALAAYENWVLSNRLNYEHKYFLLKAECHHLHGE
ncbi:hypothetical protein ACHAWX_003243, partial [Stephanocyclus meneghinianus]